MSAIIVKGGKIMGKGFNRSKPARVAEGYFSTHAECAALNKVKNPEGADAYVFRMLRSGGPGMAKPCVLCEGLLRSKGIKRVIYTINQPPFLKEMKL